MVNQPVFAVSNLVICVRDIYFLVFPPPSDCGSAHLLCYLCNNTSHIHSKASNFADISNFYHSRTHVSHTHLNSHITTSNTDILILFSFPSSLTLSFTLFILILLFFFVISFFAKIYFSNFSLIFIVQQS